MKTRLRNSIRQLSGSVSRMKLRGGSLAVALLAVSGTALAQSWIVVAVLPDGGVIQYDAHSIKRHTYLGLSDYVAGQSPPHWESTAKYEWPTDQRTEDGKTFRTAVVRNLWQCKGEDAEKVATSGFELFDVNGKTVGGESINAFHELTMLRWSLPQNEEASLGAFVCGEVSKRSR